MSPAAYSATFTDFLLTDRSLILQELKKYVPDASASQITAWRDSLKILHNIITHYTTAHPNSQPQQTIILEYTIPLESRRIDAVFLIQNHVVVLEFKGKPNHSQADLDQTTAYARDLSAYHMACSTATIHPILIPTQSTNPSTILSGAHVICPTDLPHYLTQITTQTNSQPPIQAHSFLADDAYQPLPSLITAARELFTSGTLTRIHRAAMATEPTIAACNTIIHQTAANHRRTLILIAGVPGAGKTLVGLQLAHAKYLNDLAITRANGLIPTAPAVFLSGNGPLVEVLQYELRSAGGDGKAFVRGVHDYVKTFTRSKDLVPPQHVLIYDEAQRAFDAEQVAEKHKDLPSEFYGCSEPELFIKFAERIPQWCVVVGLIGSGQEIHIGEEAGIAQWKTALQKATTQNWDLYLPSTEDILPHFAGMPNLTASPLLHLSTTIRFHLATQLTNFVTHLLAGQSQAAKEISTQLQENGYHLRITHDLQKAKTYLTDRYQDHPTARFGIVASAKDKELPQWGIPKGFKSPGEVSAGRYGKWYAEPQGSYGSCTNLDTVATEFGSQGLELDGVLLAWGTDLIRQNNTWTNQFASGYQQASRVKDPKNLRLNAYRVLLTRGRDCTVLYIPPIPGKMNETYAYLHACGFLEL
jgi:hypothetical protein